MSTTYRVEALRADFMHPERGRSWIVSRRGLSEADAIKLASLLDKHEPEPTSRIVVEAEGQPARPLVIAPAHCYDLDQTGDRF